MAIRIAEPASTPRHRWVWSLALAPILLSLNWYFARPDSVGLLGQTETWTLVTGPRLGAEAAFAVTFLLLGLIPAAVTPFVFGRSPVALGLGLGDVRVGTRLLGLGVPIAVLAGFVSARSETLAAVYPLGSGVTGAFGSFAPYAAAYLLYYIGFEFHFRGFLLLGIADRIGPTAANLLQTGLATLVHFGKPGVELAAAFPASLLFGWVTLRTGSIWYAVVIHWVVAMSLDWFLLGP